MAKKQRGSEVSVFLGADSILQGNLNFSGHARLDGRFQGDIQGSGDLTIGPSAQIEGSIECASIVISGSVSGDIKASNRLELRSPGQLKGDISAPLVVMDEGVLYEGRCSMAGEGSEDRASNITLLSSGK